MTAPPPGPETVELEALMAVVEETLLRSTGSRYDLMQDMARHVTLAGGKRFRPRLLLVVHRACGARGVTRVVEAAAAIELIHAASLVHDDIIDHSDVRRGRWTVHTRYGLPEAIIAGDYLFTRGYGLAARIGERGIRIFEEACTELCEGEVLEQRWAGRPDLPVETYLEIIRKKTAEPIRACGRAGAALADAPAELERAMGDFGLNLGLAFQIWDDILDLRGELDVLGKPPGLDLDRGVLTLPLLLHREAGGDLPRIRTPERVLKALAATDALSRAEEAARRYAEAALKHLDPVPESPHKAMLSYLAQQAIERST